MKVAVIGAGIIGITTAYELAADGHEVTVLERRGAAAEEASFAHAGLLAPHGVMPWTPPDLPGRQLSLLLGRHTPLRLGLPLSAAQWAWLWRWYRASRLESVLARQAQLQQLARYSLARLQHLSIDLQLEYEGSMGCLLLLRTEKDQRLVQPRLQALRDAGVAFSEVTAEAARQIEPALNPDTGFAAAVHLPDDPVANCRQFALLLKHQAQLRGARFEFQTTVRALDPAQPGGIWVAGEREARRFDHLVLCAGQASATLLAPLGVKLPLVGISGYCLSAPVREPLNAPRSALIDERHQVAMARLGNRVRVAGGAGLGGSAHSLRAASIRMLHQVLHDWFPGVAQPSRIGAGVQEFQGARPMLPDGPPIIGPSGVPGLWLNLGHGDNGWTLACGSARALADRIAGRSADVDMQGLDVSRLGVVG